MNTAGLILLAPEEAPDDRAVVGGKAVGLLLLARAGANVPPWRVIPAACAAERPWRDDPDARRALEDCFALLHCAPFHGVAVRSSAVWEDAAGASHAGLYETCFVTEPGALSDALDRVADSAEGTSAHGRHARPARGGMAIIVQAAVTPAMAGVLFSADPAAASYDHCCVEAVSGRGEGLVSGAKTPSRFRIAIETGELVDAAPGADGPPVLDPALARELRAHLLRLEDVADAALDIEWAVDAQGGLWLLQARPITALQIDAALTPACCATSWFLDQRFSGPMSPIARTALLPQILRVAVNEALALRGLEAPAPLAVFHAGRAYVAHEAYRRMFAGAPRWLLSEDLRQLFPPVCACRPAAGAPGFFHYAWTTLRTLICEFRPALLNLFEWKRFRASLAEAFPDAVPRDETNAADLFEDPDAWRTRWRELDAWTLWFLRLHRWSLLWADYGYRIYRALLGIMPEHWVKHIEAQFHAEICLITEQANALLDRFLAGDAAAEAELAGRFRDRSASLDYMTPTWGEMLEHGTLKSVYAAAVPSSAPGPSPAPARISRALSLLMWPLRRAIEMREEQRFNWEHILARQRRLLIAAGRTLERRGALEGRDDVWYLEFDELLACLLGDPAPAREVIAARRRTARIDRCAHAPQFTGPVPAAKPNASATVLHGAGASAGLGRGFVRVFQGTPAVPEDLVPPVIAVMAALDPAWTILLPHMAGVVLERGGLLSHAAILAREYGVPLVTGVADATRLLEDGMEVAIDGARGLVHVQGGDATNTG